MKLVCQRLSVLAFAFFACCKSDNTTSESALAHKANANHQADTSYVPRASIAVSDVGDAPDPRKELLPFIGKGYKLHEVLKGDLNGDKMEDFILLLRNTKTTTQEEDENEKLLVHLIVRKADSSLSIHSSNGDLIEYTEVGSDNEPDHMAVDSKGDGFRCFYSIKESNPLLPSNSVELNFKYSKKSNQWNLAERVDEIVYDYPTTAISKVLSEAQAENPGLTQSQMDSLGRHYETVFTDKVKRIVRKPLDFGVVSFPKAKRDFLRDSE